MVPNGSLEPHLRPSPPSMPLSRSTRTNRQLIKDECGPAIPTPICNRAQLGLHYSSCLPNLRVLYVDNKSKIWVKLRRAKEDGVALR